MDITVAEEGLLGTNFLCLLRMQKDGGEFRINGQRPSLFLAGYIEKWVKGKPFEINRMISYEDLHYLLRDVRVSNMVIDDKVFNTHVSITIAPDGSLNIAASFDDDFKADIYTAFSMEPQNFFALLKAFDATRESLRNGLKIIAQSFQDNQPLLDRVHAQAEIKWREREGIR